MAHRDVWVYTELTRQVVAVEQYNEFRLIKGEWQDSLLYVILDHEWEALSKERDVHCWTSM